MDQQKQHYKVTFTNDKNQEGFKFFFNDRDVLDFLSKRPNGARVVKLEQYDRETNSFQLIK